MLLRMPLRLLLLVYFLMPLISIGILFFMVQQAYSTVEPVVTNATTAISDAAETVEDELSDLGDNFQPLVNTVNATRNALDTVIGFVRGTINGLINTVEDICDWIPGISCNWNGLPPINLPSLVDLSFLDRIGNSITSIADNVNAVTTTLTSTIATYQLMILASFGILVLWVILSYFLVNIAIYRSLIK